MNAPHREHWGPSVSPVVLDIGGDVGAAIVVTPERLTGAEVEIRRLREPWEGRHVAVRARPGPGATVFAAVFPALDAGAYELRVRGGGSGPPHQIVVSGGDIVWHHWDETHSPGHREPLREPQREPLREEEHTHVG